MKLQLTSDQLSQYHPFSGNLSDEILIVEQDQQEQIHSWSCVVTFIQRSIAGSKLIVQAGASCQRLSPVEPSLAWWVESRCPSILNYDPKKMPAESYVYSLAPFNIRLVKMCFHDFRYF